MSEPPTAGQGAPDVTPEPVATTTPETPAAAPGTSLDLWERLKHHKVMQWTLAYAAAAYTLLHGAEMVSNALHWPELVVRITLVILVLGLPIAVLLAWYHGHKAQHRISGPELAMLTVLLFMAGTILWAVSRNGGESATVDSAKPGVAVPTAPAAPRTAVAVLPFANLTGDATKDYLGEGMAEELINTLTKVAGLKVPSRTSSFAYKGRNTDLKQIAQDLSVGTVLEGSVRSAGANIRITAQLIDAQSDRHLWSETYDRKFTDLFKLQDDLATAIARALQANLADVPNTSVAQAPPTADVEAYRLYLQGASLMAQNTLQSEQRALELFQQVLARDPKFARAYASVANVHYTQYAAFGQPIEHLAEAERAAQRALALDSSVPLAHDVLAVIGAARGQWLEMATHNRTMLSLHSDDAMTLSHLAVHYRAVGQLRRALELANQAYALAPANASIAATLADTHVFAGHDADALKYAQLAVELGFPKTDGLIRMVDIYTALRAKRYAQIRESFTTSNQADSAAAELAGLIADAMANPTQRAAAIAARARLYPRRAPSQAAGGRAYFNCVGNSHNYVLIAALDAAYDLAYQCLDAMPVVGATPGDNAEGLWTPEMRPFRQDARFQAYVSRLGLMQYWQQYGPPDDCDLKDGKLSCH
jgi:TolB-like protein